jgi:ribosome biogenesis SPOUT family RNA methylase Rps3
VGDRPPLIVIEHLENNIRLWIMLEYRHASIIAEGHIFFTNVPPRYHSLLSKYGKVYSESVEALIKRNILPANHVIVLDPTSNVRLDRNDLKDSIIVIGGILGDYPPRRRTRSMLTSRLAKYGVKVRNIGDGQYSIDGSVYYVYSLWRGLEKYKYADGVTIKTNSGTITLPFRYPLVKGKPLLAPGLLEYLEYGRLPDHIAKELGLAK